MTLTEAYNALVSTWESFPLEEWLSVPLQRALGAIREAAERGWPVYLNGRRIKKQNGSKMLLVPADVGHELIKAGLIEINNGDKKGPGPCVRLKGD